MMDLPRDFVRAAALTGARMAGLGEAYSGFFASASTHSATCTALYDYGFCPCRLDLLGMAVEVPESEKPPKYDPGRARQMWQPEALQATARPRKRPSRQVEFNQVSRLRPVRPRFMSRK